MMNRKIGIILILSMLVSASFIMGIACNSYSCENNDLCKCGQLFLSPLCAAEDSTESGAISGEESPEPLKSETDDITLYKVMAITLIIWFGISAYLVVLNRKMKLLEKKADEL